MNNSNGSNQTGLSLPRGVSDLGMSVFFALFALLLVNLHGPYFEFDSSKYLVIADQLSHGNFDRLHEYAPLMAWTVGLLNFVFQDLMFAINVYFLLAWLLMFLVIRLALRTGAFAMAFFVVFLFANSATAFQFTRFLTELGFSAIMLVCVLALGAPELSDRDKSGFFTRHREIIFLVALAMTPMQRYVGGFTAVYFAIIYLIESVDLKDVQSRLIKLVSAALPFLLVLFWNFVITGKLGGFRGEAERGLSENMALLWQVLAQHYAFEVVIYVLAAAVLAFSIVRRRNERALRRTVALVLLLLVPIVQMWIQVASSANFYTDVFNPRFVVVVLPIVAAFVIRSISLFSTFAVRLAPVLDEQFLREAVWLLGMVALAWGRGWPVQNYFASLHDVSKRPDLSKTLAQPGLNQIALVEADSLTVFASEILTGRLTYELPCRSYTIKGSRHLSSFEFVPECEGVFYPVFRPTIFDSWDMLPSDTDGLLFRYFSQPNEVAISMVETMPSCATAKVSANWEYSHFGYPYYVFFDLRTCADWD